MLQSIPFSTNDVIFSLGWMLRCDARGVHRPSQVCQRCALGMMSRAISAAFDGSAPTNLESHGDTKHVARKA